MATTRLSAQHIQNTFLVTMVFNPKTERYTKPTTTIRKELTGII